MANYASGRVYQEVVTLKKYNGIDGGACQGSHSLKRERKRTPGMASVMVPLQLIRLMSQ